MSVTYQVNYLVKFPDNVCDTSIQPYHQIFLQCVWQIRRTVSLYHPIFRHCPWHIWSTTLLNQKDKQKLQILEVSIETKKKNNVETIQIPYYRLRTENKCICGSSNRINKKVMWTLSEFLLQIRKWKKKRKIKRNTIYNIESPHQQTTVHFELYNSFMFLT